ncbi:phage head-binding domain-containing protein [Escherichia coli]|uniref:phage head-binding domain-containing protein n=1 Tax=Escherichia coli TaxID=562 RepID=UPI001FCEFD32|nr:phage head-binding domain-containing protein [Escherichia coli]
MTDITANVVVSMPSQLFTMARSFKAVANGKIYIGKIDTDPVNPENRIQVYVENEDGSHVPVSQPIIINAGGYPVYNGQIAKFVTVQGHSMDVYDAHGARQFYFPNVLKYDPDQLEQRLALTTGAGLVGFEPTLTYPDNTVGYWLNEAFNRRQKNIIFATADAGIPNDGSDVSTQVSMFLNANKGKFIVFESGTYMFDGVILSGTGWEGTVIHFIGEHLLTPDTTGTNTPGYGSYIGIVVTKDVNGLTLHYRGNGNRDNQYDRQHIFNVAIFGATNINIPYFECNEIMGDGLYVNSEDQNSATSQNTTNLTVGVVKGKNSVVSGRNLVSIASCNRGHIASCISENIGGVVGGVLQPGGLDIEPNNQPGCLVRDFIVDGATAIGAGGVYMVADWTANPKKIQNCHVKQANIRGGQMARIYGADGSSMVADCSNVTNGMSMQGCTRSRMDVIVNGCEIGALIGTQAQNYDCEVKLHARAITNAGVIVGGARRCKFDIDVTDWRTGGLGNFIGFWVRDLNNIGGLEYIDNSLTLVCPKTVNVVRAMSYQAGTSPITFSGVNTLEEGSQFKDWTSAYDITAEMGTRIYKKGKIPNLTFSPGVPTTGNWVAGDLVYYNNPSATNKFVGFYRITTGAGNVNGTDWGTVVFA